jgi:hypothetical protein
VSSKSNGRKPAPDLPWAAYARHSDRKQERSVLQQVAELRAARPPPADFDLADYCAAIQAKLTSGDETERRLILQAVVAGITVRPRGTVSDRPRVHIEFNYFPR